MVFIQFGGDTLHGVLHGLEESFLLGICNSVVPAKRFSHFHYVVVLKNNERRLAPVAYGDVKIDERLLLPLGGRVSAKGTF